MQALKCTDNRDENKMESEDPERSSSSVNKRLFNHKQITLSYKLKDVTSGDITR